MFQGKYLNLLVFSSDEFISHDAIFVVRGENYLLYSIISLHALSKLCFLVWILSQSIFSYWWCAQLYQLPVVDTSVFPFGRGSVVSIVFCRYTSCCPETSSWVNNKLTFLCWRVVKHQSINQSINQSIDTSVGNQSIRSNIILQYPCCVKLRRWPTVVWWRHRRDCNTSYVLSSITTLFYYGASLVLLMWFLRSSKLYGPVGQWLLLILLSSKVSVLFLVRLCC